MRIIKRLLLFVFLLSSFCISSDVCMAATLNWKGYTWTVTDGEAWGDELNTYSSSNVVGPDANGYITLKMTNQTGWDPVGSEIYCEQNVFGYGTYTTVVGSSLSSLDKNIVFNGMAVMRDDNPWFELDGAEASRWDDSGSNVMLSHQLWFGDNYNSDYHGDDMSIASDAVQTHRMIWEPGKITFDSFLGTGTGGTNYYHTVVTQDVPAPTVDEYVDVSLWAYANGDPTSGDWDVPATNVVIRDFTFTSYYAHALTVNSGTGDGSYTSGTGVTVIADAPAAGQVFDKWTGDTAYLSSTTTSTATVTMPGSAIAITATYKAAPVVTYVLTVNSGTGDGSYASGTTVAVTADSPAAGQVFDKWTGDTAYLSSTTASSAVVTMPSSAIAITATYKAAPVNTYALNVINGTGDGSYTSGTTVAVTADSPAAGQVFDKWTGDTAYLSNTTTSTATVTMPSQAIAVAASYKAAPVNTYALTVNNGTGDGAYASSASVTVTADAPAAGQVFDKWTGNTSYVANTTSSTTTVTMPAQAVAITATYKAAPVNTYTLTVVNGTGDGDYTSGTSATVTANSPAAGQVFDRWTGDTYCLSNLYTSTATVTMPAQSVAIAATYKASAVTTYDLTVNSGTGDGAYTLGANVTVTANSPAAGQVFDQWTGDTSYLSSVYTSTATAMMPSSSVSITATYKAADATTYVLSVANGAGDGSYTSGASVTITADSPAAGQVFNKWTGDTTYLSSIYTSTATVTMPAQAIALTATYKTAAATTYALAITNGTGDGSYAAGTSVTVSANSAAKGQIFDQWVGDTTYLSSVYTATATVSMPAKDITLTATYRKSVATTYSLTIGSGTGDGNYTAGEVITITADTPATGQVFDKWVGDTAYLSSVYTSSATVTMPATAITLTATYKNSVSTTYKVNIVSGSGSGYYASGFDISIAASVAPAGKVFDQWMGDIAYVLDPRKAVTRITVPERDITVTATYKNSSSSYADGTLIKTPDSFKIYVMISGKKKWIPTPEVFEQLGYMWTSVVEISREKLDLIPDFEDNLIRSIGDYKVYLVVNGVKRHIPNPNIFLDYGFKWEEVKDVPQSTIDQYKDTYLIKQSKSNGIYYLTPQEIRKLIPTTEVFNSYNDNMADVQVISKTEMDCYPLANLIKLGGSNDIYFIEGNTKRRIPSSEIFNRYKFNWNYVVTVNRTEFDYYQTGTVLN